MLSMERDSLEKIVRHGNMDMSIHQYIPDIKNMDLGQKRME